MTRRRVKRPGQAVVGSSKPPEGETPEPKPTPPENRSNDGFLRPGIAWGNVINDTVKIDDPTGLAERLRKELTLGNFRHDYGRLIEALDDSAKNLNDAGMLLSSAKVERDRFALEAGERIGILRQFCTKELMLEYKSGKRKSPTKDDIEDRCLENYPKEYRTLKQRISELEQAVRSLETLRDAWQSRCADLRLMTDRAAKKY